MAEKREHSTHVRLCDTSDAMLYLHPRYEQRYRDAKLPTAGLMSFRCKCCHRAIFTMAGRKKLAGGGWKCAECCK